MALTPQELETLMERFEALGLDELVLSVDGTQVELTSSGEPPAGAEQSAPPTATPHEVTAPSVGIARPLVAVDGEVGAEDVVCHLEVWKSTIEVQAGIAGTVRELHVEEGTMVEYGQSLLSIRPA